jgi:catabolite regulation protein CreA
MHVTAASKRPAPAPPARQPAAPCRAAPAAAAAAAPPLARLCAVAAAAALALAPPACAAERVAEFAGSGFLAKDTIQVLRLDDPELEGASIYLTEYSRSFLERLSSDPFGDPSQTSLTCVGTGPGGTAALRSAGSAYGGASGKEVFSESKSLNLLQNKRQRVRRVVDAERGVVVYVGYSTRNSSAADEGGVSSSRYRTSLCALPLAPAPAAAAE